MSAVEKLISPGMAGGWTDEWCFPSGCVVAMGKQPLTATASWYVALLCPEMSVEGAATHRHDAVPGRVTFLTAGRAEADHDSRSRGISDACAGCCRRRAPTMEALREQWEERCIYTGSAVRIQQQLGMPSSNSAATSTLVTFLSKESSGLPCVLVDGDLARLDLGL